MTDEKPKGDPWIIERLEEARRRNAIGDNPNRVRPRIVFDFNLGKVCIEEAA